MDYSSISMYTISRMTVAKQAKFPLCIRLFQQFSENILEEVSCYLKTKLI